MRIGRRRLERWNSEVPLDSFVVIKSYTNSIRMTEAGPTSTVKSFQGLRRRQGRWRPVASARRACQRLRKLEQDKINYFGLRTRWGPRP